MQSTVQSVLNMKELRSKRSTGLEVPCQVFPFVYGLFPFGRSKKLGSIPGSHQVNHFTTGFYFLLLTCMPKHQPVKMTILLKVTVGLVLVVNSEFVLSKCFALCVNAHFVFKSPLHNCSH